MSDASIMQMQGSELLEQVRVQVRARQTQLLIHLQHLVKQDILQSVFSQSVSSLALARETKEKNLASGEEHV